jgi:hypothetical protein
VSRAPGAVGGAGLPLRHLPPFVTTMARMTRSVLGRIPRRYWRATGGKQSVKVFAGQRRAAFDAEARLSLQMRRYFSGRPTLTETVISADVAPISAGSGMWSSIAAEGLSARVFARFA